MQDLTPQQRKRLDRQRFIGLQTQRKLINTRVLITPANGPNTELAKNLILAGVDVTLYDSAIVTEDDFESNFLISEQDIGQKRVQAVFKRLKEMNPSGKNQMYFQNLQEKLANINCVQFFKRFTMLATSFTTYKQVNKWDILSKTLNIPYYNLVCCGLYGYVYISLGNRYTYREINKHKHKEVEDKIWQIESLTFLECLKDIEIVLKNGRESKQWLMEVGILMMYEAEEEKLDYDPFDCQEGNRRRLEKIVELGGKWTKGGKKEFLQGFVRMFGIDYCPVYSVIGSIVSQEMIKVVENTTEPAVNWLIFDSNVGKASVIKLGLQKERIILKEAI